jgi:rod shape-determining protein MreC
LREENARLLQWQELARRLVAENAQLRGLVKFTPENGAPFFVSAQVVANSGGAFARNVLVNAGSREGVARGQAAVAGEGLVGRVSEVGDRSARILLLTDLNSRIPVVLSESRERAVMAGDNSDRPRLLYVPANISVKVGERIVTGSAGGVFPPDIPVGVVASVDGTVITVEPYADLSRIEYVRVIDFGLAGVLPQNVVPLPKAPKSAKPVDPDAAR